jgi:hypothetical protein
MSAASNSEYDLGLFSAAANNVSAAGKLGGGSLNNYLESTNWSY